MIQCVDLFIYLFYTFFLVCFRGSLLCEKGLQSRETSRYRCPESAGYQVDAELQVEGVRKGDLCMDALLLVPHQ